MQLNAVKRLLDLLVLSGAGKITFSLRNKLNATVQVAVSRYHSSHHKMVPRTINNGSVDSDKLVFPRKAHRSGKQKNEIKLPPQKKNPQRLS